MNNIEQHEPLINIHAEMNVLPHGVRVAAECPACNWRIDFAELPDKLLLMQLFILFVW